jgi:16S rRNA (guanine527-N7)-methyltransferase
MRRPGGETPTGRHRLSRPVFQGAARILLAGGWGIEVRDPTLWPAPWYQYDMTSTDRATDTAPASLSEPQRQTLASYRDLLLRWNQRFNLTAVTDPSEVDRKLVGDALAMLPALDEAVETLPGKPFPAKLIDVGSGAGFPGLVLAIVRPDIDVTLLDATRKKVGFLEAAILELGIANARPLHARAEELGQNPDHRERYDIVTARAVAALPALLELCVPLLRVGGRGIFPKGSAIAEETALGELAADQLGARIVATEEVFAPDSTSATRLVFAIKVKSTPSRYPRRSGIPVREPLGRVHR